MFNVIKMDLYRLFRSKSFRVGLILVAIISFAAAALSSGIAAIMKSAIDLEPELAESYVTLGGIMPFLLWGNSVDLGVVILQFSSIFSLAIAAIISAIYVNDEQMSGYGKNYLGQLSNKGQSVISKMIATSLINVCIVLTCVIASGIGGMIFFGKIITSFNFGNFAVLILLRILMYLAINAIIVFFSLLTRSKSASMIIGVLFGVGASKLAYTGATTVIQMIVSKVFRNDSITVPNLDGLIPDGVESMLNLEFLNTMNPDVIIRALIVGVVYIAVFTTLSFCVVRKRDLK